jgi:hypothetical protein
MPSARMAGMSAELPGPLGVIHVPARGEYVRPGGTGLSCRGGGGTGRRFRNARPGMAKPLFARFAIVSC